MPQAIDVFIEYKIDEKFVKKYEEAMSEVKRVTEEQGAYDFNWYVAHDQPHLYVEMFKVTSHKQYEEIKVMRRSEHTPITSYIVGGAKKLNCWAFVRKDC